jgi:dTDP-glucose 4,6-dehydratase
MLITGGAGFIGCNFVRHVLRHRPDRRIINLDALTYCGNVDNLPDDRRHTFVHGDVCDAQLVEEVMGDCDTVVHIAAETHVDRSIVDAAPFVRTNVEGTQTLLDAAVRCGVEQFVYVSTDEVYGALELDAPHRFTETSPLRPTSPYAASKTAGDLLAQAAFATHGLPVVIARCGNNFGPYQFPEKIIPLFVTNLLQGQRVPLYGDGRHVRDWIHVEDHCEALLLLAEQGKAGEVYNIGADNEQANLDLTRMLVELCGADASMIEHVKDRPGHDRRYALDASKLRTELGWRPTRSAWPAALEQTVQWYRDHESWWRRLRDDV